MKTVKCLNFGCCSKHIYCKSYRWTLQIMQGQNSTKIEQVPQLCGTLKSVWKLKLFQNAVASECWLDHSPGLVRRWGPLVAGAWLALPTFAHSWPLISYAGILFLLSPWRSSWPCTEVGRASQSPEDLYNTGTEGLQQHADLGEWSR